MKDSIKMEKRFSNLISPLRPYKIKLKIKVIKSTPKTGARTKGFILILSKTSVNPFKKSIETPFQFDQL
jgi:hypothetical protein